MALDEAQERRILIGDPRHHHALADRAAEERLEVPLAERALGAGNRVAVRVGFGMAEHFVHPLDQPIGDDVLEVLGVVVHLVPAHAHHLDQEQFDQAVAAQHRRRQP